MAISDAQRAQIDLRDAQISAALGAAHTMRKLADGYIRTLRASNAASAQINFTTWLAAIKTEFNDGRQAGIDAFTAIDPIP